MIITPITKEIIIAFIIMIILMIFFGLTLSKMIYGTYCCRVQVHNSTPEQVSNILV